MKAKVLIRPKEGILDLETDDPDSLAELCEKLLANPLIEDYEIELNGGGK